MSDGTKSDRQTVGLQRVGGRGFNLQKTGEGCRPGGAPLISDGYHRSDGKKP
jgi:hypothetical protein